MKKEVHQDLLEMGLAGGIGGLAVGFVNGSTLQPNIKNSVSNFIGVGLISEFVKKIK